MTRPMKKVRNGPSNHNAVLNSDSGFVNQSGNMDYVRLDVNRMLEARVRIELTHNGFADHSLTTWVPRLCEILCPTSMPKTMPNAPYYRLLSPFCVSVTH